jgi:hypothetical protein
MTKNTYKRGLAPAVIIAIVALVIILGLAFLDRGQKRSVPQPIPSGEENATTTSTPTVVKVPVKKDPATSVVRPSQPILAGGIDLSKVDFVVDGKSFKFGVDEKTKERREVALTVVGDLNRDGIKDAGVVLVEFSAGSGNFYYAVFVEGNGRGSGKATNAFYLGDRVRIQNLSIEDNEFVVRLMDRLPGEAFTTQPSVPKRKAFFLSGNSLIEDIK